MTCPDTVALLVALRAVRDHLRDSPSLKPVFEKHARGSVPEAGYGEGVSAGKASGAAI